MRLFAVDCNKIHMLYMCKKGKKAVYMVMGRTFKLIRQAAVVCLCMVLHCGIVSAADSTKVMEKYSGESEIALYVKGPEDAFENITVQVGTYACSAVEKDKLSDTKQPVRTLVMLDNSESIPKKDKKKISKILRNLISDRAENEQIAIAVLNKEMEYLTDYTSDYEQLKSAVNEITYRKTETYLTDMLYEWIKEKYIPGQAEGYYRILVIADGTDNKPIGYTQDEFYSLLKEYPVPIYTAGVRTKDNNENLENMFAISRASNAESFLLEDMEDVQDIREALRSGRDIMKIVIKPQAELLDGNKKSVKILLASGETLSTEAVMPQMVREQKETVAEEKKDEEKTNKEDVKPAAQKEKNEKDSAGSKKHLIFAAAAGTALLLLAAVLILIIRKKKVKEQPAEETSIEDLVSQVQEQQADVCEDGTVIGAVQPSACPDETVVVWNPGVAYQLVLRNVKAPAKSIEFPLKGSATIGRKPGVNDIVFENDRTVSGRHCEVAVRDGRYYITDLKSSNGTYVNGRRVMSEMEVFSGDLLRLGNLELKFEIK